MNGIDYLRLLQSGLQNPLAPSNALAQNMLQQSLGPVATPMPHSYTGSSMGDSVLGYLSDAIQGKNFREGMNRLNLLAEAGVTGDLSQLAGTGLLEDMMPGGGVLSVAKKGAKLAAELPMDEASRMARAREMGFDTDAYHGTHSDIRSFEPSERGKVTKARSAKEASWFAENPDTSAGYADLAADSEVQKLIDASYKAERSGRWDEANDLMRQAEELDAVAEKGQNVIPVKLRGNLMEYDAEGQWLNQLDEGFLADLTKQAKDEGYDGLKITNFVDEANYGVDRPTTHYAIFDPKNIRSRFAKFDPSKKNSKNLLDSLYPAGIGMGLIGGGLLSQDEQYY